MESKATISALSPAEALLFLSRMTFLLILFFFLAHHQAVNFMSVSAVRGVSSGVALNPNSFKATSIAFDCRLKASHC